MAGNKKTTELAVVPSPINGSVYIAKDGIDYQVLPGTANGLATLDGSIKLALSQLPTHTHLTADITNLSSYTGFDARYYTEAEVDTFLAGKANTAHTHTTSQITDLAAYTGFDARYYTEAEVNSLLSGKANTSHTHVISDVTGLQASLDSKLDDSQATATGLDILNSANQDEARDAVGIYVQAGDPGAVADGSLWFF